MMDITPTNQRRQAGPYEPSENYLTHNDEEDFGEESMISESGEIPHDAALKRMKKLAQKIYDTTPELS